MSLFINIYIINFKQLLPIIIERNYNKYKITCYNIIINIFMIYSL